MVVLLFMQIDLSFSALFVVTSNAAFMKERSELGKKVWREMIEKLISQIVFL